MTLRIGQFYPKRIRLIADSWTIACSPYCLKKMFYDFPILSKCSFLKMIELLLQRSSRVTNSKPWVPAREKGGGFVSTLGYQVPAFYLWVYLQKGDMPNQIYQIHRLGDFLCLQKWTFYIAVLWSYKFTCFPMLLNMICVTYVTVLHQPSEFVLAQKLRFCFSC